MLSLRTVRTAAAVSRVLPPSLAVPLAGVAGRAYRTLAADERVVVERNLRRIYGDTPFDVDRSVDAVFEGYARYWYDTLRLPHLGAQAIDRGFTYEGLERILDPVEQGATPVVAMPHVGSWEWAAAWMTQVAGLRVSVVAERLEPEELFDWFVGFRQGLGMDVIPLGPSAAAELARAVEPGRLIALVGDRDVSGDGIPVEFFGEHTTMPGGPALLALRNGVPLLPAAVYHRDGRCHGVVAEPLDTTRQGRLREDVARVTQELAHAFEVLIAAAPEQWHVLQPNWPSDLVALGREHAAAP